MAAKAKSDIIAWTNSGVASSSFVRIFMQITSDPMRSAKLLFALKVASGDFPSGSTYLRLLVIIQNIFRIKRVSYYQWPFTLDISEKWP